MGTFILWAGIKQSSSCNIKFSYSPQQGTKKGNFIQKRKLEITIKSYRMLIHQNYSNIVKINKK